jgi:hypothetical protein
MVSFVHIADKNDEQAILRGGIRAPKGRSGVRGIYAMPVIPNFATTHQWARELKRGGTRTLICIQFKVPNAEPVLVGKFNEDKIKMTAAEALGTVLKHTDPMGLEIIFPRKITADEITRTNLAPRIVGWRFSPAAKGKPPFCRCRWCNRGEIRASRIIREDG